MDLINISSGKNILQHLRGKVTNSETRGSITYLKINNITDMQNHSFIIKGQHRIDIGEEVAVFYYGINNKEPVSVCGYQIFNSKFEIIYSYDVTD